MRNRSVYYISLVMLTLSIGCSSTDEAKDSGSGVQSRGLQQLQRQMQPGIAVKPGMQAQPGAPVPATIQLPTWPQKFEVQGPDVDSFGFAVTQAGPIAIDVQAQGAPILVTLQSAGSQPITRQATGNLRMNHMATPQDVQRSLFWTVEIRLAQPMPPQQGGRAGGTIDVQHPPVNHQQVQTALVAHQQAVQQQRPQLEAQAQQADAQAAAQIEQAVQQRKAQFEQQEAGRRAALFAQIQPHLNQLRGQVGAAIRPRGLEGDVPEVPSAAEESAAPAEGTEEIGTRGGLKSLARPGDRKFLQVAPPVSASQQASTAESAPPQQVMPNQNPVISSITLSPGVALTQGRPGDPLFINGSNFGTAGGEVRFVMGPGKDLPAPPGVVWTNNQIFATIPDPPGLLGFSGTIYIKRAGETITSNLATFRFEPILVFRDYMMTAVAPDVSYEHPTHFPDHRHLAYLYNGNVFKGLSGTNQYFVNTTLRNGWVLDEVYYSKSPYSCPGGCNYLAEKWIGNSKPYFSIRYSVNAANVGSSKYTSYLIDRITLRGPKGVPDGLSCMQAPCP